MAEAEDHEIDRDFGARDSSRERESRNPIDQEGAPESAPESADYRDFESGLRASKKRLWMGIAAAATVIGLVAGGLAWGVGSKLPAYDSKDAESVRKGIASMSGEPADRRRMFAAAALAELEEARLPKPLLEAFKNAGSAPPGMVRLLLLKAMTEPEAKSLWNDLCAGGTGVLAEMMKLERMRQAEHVYRQCGLETRSLVSLSEAKAADAAYLAVAYAALHHLETNRADTELERGLFRMFMKDSLAPSFRGVGAGRLPFPGRLPAREDLRTKAPSVFDEIEKETGERVDCRDTCERLRKLAASQLEHMSDQLSETQKEKVEFQASRKGKTDCVARCKARRKP